jgi:signal transduction histidine kinase
LDNAIKFTNPEEEVRLHLHTSGTSVSWEVSNPGEVLPEKVLRDLFSLSVAPTYGTQKEKGTGIGLSLSKEIADSIGMKLTYAYKKGRHCFALEKLLFS